jgi:hypothetical protein
MNVKSNLHGERASKERRGYPMLETSQCTERSPFFCSNQHGHHACTSTEAYVELESLESMRTLHVVYRSTSHKKTPTLGPCRRPMPRVVGGS